VIHIDDISFLYLLLGAFFVCMVIFSLLLNGLMLKFASTLGIRNHDETIIRWSSASKPALGGISFYIIFLLSVTSYSLFIEQSSILLNKELIGLLAATGLAFLMGLSDDAYDTKPLLKLFVQIVCGVILISTGTYIHLFPSDALNYVFTILWVVGIMNSINMLDNMDAIATIASIFIVGAALFIILLSESIAHFNAFIIAGVLAALIGFLFFNWHPSKMFMGDTGSQFLGIFLAFVGISYFWNHTEVSGTEIPTKQFIITILAFTMPIIDTTTVTINRILSGNSPFVGGKDHTTHYLSYIGFSDKMVARLFILFSFISITLVFIAVKWIDDWNYIHVALFSAYFATVFISLYSITKIKKAKLKFFREHRNGHSKLNGKNGHIRPANGQATIEPIKIKKQRVR